VPKIRPVIMCGGSGTRMWPESRESLPKQFISLIGQRSTFQTIVGVVSDPAVFDPAVVITNFEYRFRVAEQLREIGAEAVILLEPDRRDSAAAVGAAAAWAAAHDPKTVVAVLAADHVFEDGKQFARLCAQSYAAADAGEIVTFGVTPDHPATGYGYIHPGAPLGLDPQVRRIERFVEKPDEANARAFIEDGYLWNSGNFLFRADVLLTELARLEPAMASAIETAVKNADTDLGFLRLQADAFAKAPQKSIDYALMEKTDRAAVVAGNFRWSDIGSWDALFDITPRSADGNVVHGPVVTVDATGNLIHSDGRLTAVAGVNDLVVVSTSDAVMVVPRARAQEVRELVARLKMDKRPEATDHKRVHRPWGYYESIDLGERFQVKRIVVIPGGVLSLQKHRHRAEHWVVVRGTAEVTIGDKIQAVHENESVFIPIGTVHRLANRGKIPLELVEVQTGSYLGEDDIERIEDIYQRK